MHRKSLLHLLETYKITSSRDQIMRDRVQSFVEQNPECFDRSLISGHITGSAWLVNPSKNKVLLTHHRKLNKWLQLGGHADGDSDVLNVALREAQEESGIEKINPISSQIFDIDVHLIPARKEEPEHFHYDIRFILQAQSEDFQISSESNKLAWISHEELPSLNGEESMLAMHRKWKLLNV